MRDDVGQRKVVWGRKAGRLWGMTLAPSTRHRWQLIIMGLCLILITLVGSGWVYSARHAEVGLHAGTLAVGDQGVEEVSADGSIALIPGTRVISSATKAPELAANQRAWLAAGTMPTIPELGESDLVSTALLDLHVLTTTHQVTVAGWTPLWRYVWPRDSAFAASAFARTGHLPEAEALISFLERQQPPYGIFQARYRPDGTGPPDDRGEQLDGLGWSLWGMGQVADELHGTDRTAFIARHRTLLDKATQTITQLPMRADGLPPISPDYWEVKESKPTLATAAVLASGLNAAARLYAMAGDDRASEATTAAHAQLTQAIHTQFADDGYPRRLGGGDRSVDLGVSFLLPPFTTATDPTAAKAWAAAPTSMARPAGGLAPGGSWKNDGISWTPTTATYAMVAAAVDDRALALRYLHWIDAHRTPQGSIPEKVLYDGRPASVAPISWSAAAVIIAVDELAEQ